MTTPFRFHSSKQNGFNMVELMVATALGLFLTAAVSSIFVAGNKNYKQDDRFSRMQENGRFALNVLAEDLSMAGFWGGAYNLSQFKTLATWVNNCGISLTQTDPILIQNYATTTHADTTYSCITSGKTSLPTPSTAILIVKRVLGKSVTPPSSDNNAYLRVGTTSASFFQNTATLPTYGAGETDWSFIPRIYYIRKYSVTAGDGIPTLTRKNLTTSNPPTFTTASEEALVEGVENYQVEIGINTGTGTNIDTQVNYYTDAPSAAELKGAVTARIYVLVRSRDPDSAYTNNKVYKLGKKTVGYSGTGGDNPPDNYYRRVFSSTVFLRNPNFLNATN